MSTTGNGTTKIGLIAAILCAVVTAVFAGTAFWQDSVAQSHMDDSDQHQAAANAFKQAETEGQTAGTLLQDYVASGDATKIQEINTHTSTGVTLLTQAVQQSGIDGQALIDGGSALVQAEGQIIALRQAGKTAEAFNGLTQLQGSFQSFLATQQGVIDNQQTLANESRDDATSANDMVSWLVIGAVVFAIGAIASGIVHVRLTSSRRRTYGAASA